MARDIEKQLMTVLEQLVRVLDSAETDYQEAKDELDQQRQALDRASVETRKVADAIAALRGQDGGKTRESIIVEARKAPPVG